MLMGLPLDINNATPRATCVMPSVTIKGGIRNMAIMAVHHAAYDADGDGGEQRVRHRLAGFRDICRYDRSQGHIGAQPKVDAAGEYDERHAEGHNGDDGYLPEYVFEVLQLKKLGRQHGKRADQQQQDQHDRIFFKRPDQDCPRVLFLDAHPKFPPFY
jgi:hypothetical protein